MVALAGRKHSWHTAPRRVARRENFLPRGTLAGVQQRTTRSLGSGSKGSQTGSAMTLAAMKMTDQTHKAEHFRSLHVPGTPLPVTIDLESGYGDAPGVVAETIALAIEAGAVGCNLEDSFPTNGKLRETVNQFERLRTARRAAEAAGIRFFINARTDVFFQRPPAEHDNAMLDDAIERARAYAEAGADGIFVPGLVDTKLISRFAQSSPLPVNIMIGDGTSPPQVLAEHGVARVSYGPSPYLTAMKALEERARAASV